MTRKEALLEQYEDAVVALFMDRVAQAEGNWAFQENARLKEDPSAAVPEALQRRCRESIRKNFSQKRRRQTAERIGKILLRGASVLVVLAALIVLLFAVFPDLRANVLNTMLDIRDTYIDTSTFENRTPELPELEITAGWIPEGFDLEEESAIRDSALKYYTDGSGGTIEIRKAEPTTISIDTEDAEVKTVQVQGYEAALVEKTHEVTGNFEVRVIWLDTDKQVVCYVGTENISVEDVLKIAENLS